MQMFEAALESIQPNFPPAILQGDPRYTHVYANMSDGASARGPWNEGSGPWPDGGVWQYVEDPISAVRESNGLLTVKPHAKSPEQVDQLDKTLSQQRKKEVSSAMPEGKINGRPIHRERFRAPGPRRVKGQEFPVVTVFGR